MYCLYILLLKSQNCLVKINIKYYNIYIKCEYVGYLKHFCRNSFCLPFDLLSFSFHAVRIFKIAWWIRLNFVCVFHVGGGGGDLPIVPVADQKRIGGGGDKKIVPGIKVSYMFILYFV